MTKILSYYEGKKVDVVIITSLIVSIIITSSFILFSPDGNIRAYNAILTSTVSVGVAFVICFVQIFRYKKNIRKYERNRRTFAEQTNDKQLHHYYYDNNKMHFSICLFLVLWLAAQAIWLSQYQQVSYSITDALWFVGYASFGYFLYSLYYHFFRKEFEPFILILIAVIILVPLIFIVDTIVSTLRLLSIQTVDISVVIVNAVYPILDAIVIFPLIMIFWAVRRINSRRKNATLEEIKE